MDSWQASVARQNFSDVIDAAVGGQPQFVQRRDGKQVVIVSRDYYESSKPNLKTFLLENPIDMTAEEEAAFDATMYDITGSPVFALDRDRSDER